MNSMVKALAAALLAAAICPGPASCWEGEPEIGYSFVPRADYLRWNSDVGIKDAYLYGGEIGTSLDRFVALRGYFVTNSRVGTDLAPISPEFIDQDIGLSNYGVDVVLSLNQGRLVPYLRCGGGILRLDPDSGEVFNQIALRAGGGLRYQLAPGFHCEATVQDLLYRIDRTMLSGHDPEHLAMSDPERNKLRSNLAVSVGLGISVGGRPASGLGTAETAEQGIGARLAGSGWMAEGFSGRLRFDDPSDLGDREVIGGRLGANLTPNLALCGYYWRGMTKGYESAEDLQSYGGEAQFFLGRGRGALPYLLMGAGKLDFLSGFRDLEGRVRSDKALLILGAGVGFALNDYARLSVDARDYVLSERDFDEVGSPDQLRHSLAVTGAVSFILGPRRGARPGVRARGEELGGDRAPSYQSEKYVTLPVPSVGEIYVRYGEPGAVTVAPGQESAAPAPPAVLPPYALMPQMPQAAPMPPLAPVAPPEAGLPCLPSAPAVPGEPAIEAAPAAPGEGVDRDALRRMVDEELALALRAAAPAAPESAAAPDQTDALLRRIADALDQRVRTAPAEPTTIVIEQPRQAQPAAPAEMPQPAAVTPGQPSEPGQVRILPAPAAPVRPHVAYTYSGVNIDDPAQWMLGARFDAAPVRKGSRIWAVPEVGFGLFSKGSLMLAVNAQYDFEASVTVRGKRITPYIYAGAGLLHFGKGAGRDRNEGVVNLGYGLTFNVRKVNAYVEHQGVDLFSLHRLLLGVRWATSRPSP